LKNNKIPFFYYIFSGLDWRGKDRTGRERRGLEWNL